MEHLSEITDMLGEGTVRGVIITLFSTALLIVSKKTWTWLRSPTPLSPLVHSVCDYILQVARLEDSKLYGNNYLETPKIGLHPPTRTLSVDNVGDVWDTLNRHERKAVKKAYSTCVKTLRERDEAKGQRDIENMRQEAEKALLPFVRTWNSRT